MDKPVMKDTGATPTCGHLRDNASHVLLGRVYWQGWKAVWVGRKYFTSNIRSSGTEQTVCDCMCRSQWVCVGHVQAKTRKLLCERLSVWDMCGRVCVCVCGWAAFLSIKVTRGPPSALGEKWTMPNGLGLLLLFSSCHHFLLIHPKWLWVRKTHPATHPHATFATVAPEADTFSEDACKRADSNSAGKNVTDKECLWLMA